MKRVQELVAGLRLGDSMSHENVTIVAVAGEGQDAGDYVTLDQALRNGGFRVTEVSDEGSVPELKVINEGNSAVLLLDGEELVGAKQNRVLNISILVPARSSLVIPVSCVESGRWSVASEEFRSDDHAIFYRARSRKAAAVTRSMRERGDRRSDQAEVWREIDEKMHRLQSRSVTSAMNDMYQGHRASVEEYLEGLHPLEDQIGAVFLINGRVCGCEILETPAVFRELFPKLLRSYALDALEERKRAVEEGDAVSKARDFLERLRRVSMSRYPAVGVGDDIRFDDPQISGGALILGDRLIHLCAFVNPAENGSGGRERRSGMIPASRRRRHHIH